MAKLSRKRCNNSRKECIPFVVQNLSHLGYICFLYTSEFLILLVYNYPREVIMFPGGYPFYDGGYFMAILQSEEPLSDANQNFCIGWDAVDRRAYDVAFLHLKNAADAGHPHAKYNLGVCYQYGLGTVRSKTKALACYRFAMKTNVRGMEIALILYNQVLGNVNKCKQD